MKAKDIFKHLIDKAISPCNNTCDLLIAGDPEKEVYRLATCFKLTAELVKKASDMNIDMIITHEPTFSVSDLREKANAIDLKKWELIDKSGITVYRFHDHAHHSEPDYIHQGFISALDLKTKKKFPHESLGVCRYELDEEVTTRQLAERIRDVLGVEFVRIVGKDDYTVKTVCLGLGSVGFAQIDKLFDPGCDLFITGEVGEVRVDEYVRDACFFGENKSVLVLGHYSSEYAGMRYLAEELDKTLTPTVFLPGGEVYHGI